MSYEQTQSHHRDLLEIDKAKFTLGTYTTKKKKKMFVTTTKNHCNNIKVIAKLMRVVAINFEVISLCNKKFHCNNHYIYTCGENWEIYSSW